MTPANTAFANKLSFSASSVPAQPATVLVVDDDRVYLMMLQKMFEDFSYNVLTARSGEDALIMMQQRRGDIDVVIMDREMPGMNGLEAVEQMKADPEFAKIPVIMLTGSGEAEQIQQGIDAGVFYYMVKPATPQLLKSIITAALKDSHRQSALLQELSRHDAAAKTLRQSRFELSTLDEAQSVSLLLANCFPQPELVVSGLTELMINAIEHGNLGISYTEKGRLLEAGLWETEISRRLKSAEYAGRVADVQYQRRKEGWIVQITDAGPGFDWRRYWHIDPTRATASHGRGIARARLSAFDRISFNEKGNQVTCVVEVGSAPDTLEW